MAGGKRKTTKTRGGKGKQGKLPFFKKGLEDERVPKIIGVLCLLTSLYLFIAFTSYLFSWRIDQNEVLNSSAFGVLFGADVQIENWLGRLGAVISHKFFYGFLGLPSFFFVFLFFVSGLSLMTRKPLARFKRLYLYSIILMIWFAIMLAFFLVDPGLFFQSEFPWGGAFGQYLSTKFNGIFGNIGMFLLMMFSLIMLATWIFNPDFNDMTWDWVTYRIKKWTGINLNKDNRYEEKLETVTKKEPKVKEETTLKPVFSQNLQSKKDDKKETTLLIEDTTPLKKEEHSSSEKEDPQLAFDLVDKSRFKKPESVKKPEDAELEIETNPVHSGAKDPQSELVIQQENVNHSEPYDPTLELPSFENPVLSLLRDYEAKNLEIDRSELEQNKDQIIETLLNYKIEIVKIKATIGPTVTLYEIVPAAGVRISKIKNLEDDIALSLAALGIRIIAPIPGRGTIGIEVPNKNKQIVSLKEVLASEKFKRAKMDLPIALGKTISNEVFVADLSKMPHLLVAGATGQGKSVGINTIITSLLYKKHPSQLKLVLIDPKKVELSLYNKIEKHYLAFLPGEEEPILTDTAKVVNILNSLCIEMDQRYDLLKKGHVRNLREYNAKFVARKLNPLNGHKFLPYIVLVIDEFADLIMTAGKEVELPLGRLAQLARAIGIHLVIATQRPSVNIITGVIKANFPARIAFKVTSKIDSRTILDGGGADQLIGMGDMLLSADGKVVRLQCAFIDTPEVEEVVDYIGNQKGYSEPYYLPEYGTDDNNLNGGVNIDEFDSLFDEAARTVVHNQIGSTSMLQRRLKLGYNRAGRIMDQMESIGIVGPSEGSKAREVLIFDVAELERYLEQLRKK